MTTLSKLSEQKNLKQLLGQLKMPTAVFFSRSGTFQVSNFLCVHGASRIEIFVSI